VNPNIVPSDNVGPTTDFRHPEAHFGSMFSHLQTGGWNQKMGDDLVDHLVPILTHTSTGWWFQPTPLKKDDFVSWDDYSQYMEK